MKKVVLTTMSLFLLVLPLYAADMDEGQDAEPALQDEMVVKASKMDRKLEHITDSVTIINEEAIEAQGFTDVTEILRMTPSVEFKQAGGPVSQDKGIWPGSFLGDC